MDEATSIVVDHAGNVYAAGYCEQLATGRDLAVVSLNSSGNYRWRYLYNGPGNDVDAASCITLDKDEKNVYVGGYSTGAGTMLDFTVIGLDTSGKEKWVFRRNGTDNQWDEVMGIVCDSTSVYASGYTRNTGKNMDFTVARIDTTGQERWVYNHNGPVNDWDKSYDLALDKNGNVYAAGYSRQGSAPRDWTVIKVDRTGNSPWQFFYKGNAHYDDWALRILLDEGGNVYSTGATSGQGTGFDMSLVKLDSLGKKLWVYDYNGPANSDDEGKDLAIDEKENLYVAGYSTGVNLGFTIASVDSAGKERWVYRYTGEGIAWDVAADGAGSVYSCGTTKGDIASALTVIKLKTDQPHGILEKPESAEESRIPGIIAGGGISFKVPVEIFDHTGRLVLSSNDNSSVAVNKLSAGVYFIKMKERNRTQWKKVVVLK
jgi:hypothetical protein